VIELQHAGTVSTLTMGRPPVNAIDAAFVAAFDGALDAVEKARPTALVVRSSQRCFCAGADLALIQRFFGEPDGVSSMVGYVRELHRIFRRLEVLEAVTIAAVNGAAMGGGLELALACDLRVAATTARLGLPEARVGMIPGAGGTQRLTRLCGPGTASRLILGGELVDGAEAERLGLAQWSVPPAELDGKAQELAKAVGGLSRAALLASKDCILASFDRSADGYARELEKPIDLMKNADSRARVGHFLSGKAR
jgi:enoyl-CoA hydratase/carnithine racemase